jgi:uncharacterized protein (TIGR02466 family)
MSKENEIYPLFSVPLYKSNIEIDDTTIDHLKRLSFKRLNINNGFISENKNVLNMNLFKPIKDKIANHLKILLHDTFSVNNDVEWVLLNSWIMKHQKGDFSQSHRHPNSTLSGIVYFQVDENSGKLIFQNSSERKTLFDNSTIIPINSHNIFNSLSYSFQPKFGDIFIFPSHLFHSVEVSNSDADRYCIAFNVHCQGNFGKNDSEQISELLIEVKNGIPIF